MPRDILLFGKAIYFCAFGFNQQTFHLLIGFHSEETLKSTLHTEYELQYIRRPWALK